MALYIAQAVAERVGIDLGLQVVTGVVTCARNISSLMGFIKTDDDKSELITLLKNTDIELTVVILECIVEELDVDKRTPNSVINCLKSLHEILSRIEGELETIKTRVEYNRSLWYLKSFRSYGFANNITQIESLLTILKNRKELLFETIEIMHALKKGHINKSILEGTWIIPSGVDHKENVLKQLQESKLMTYKTNNKVDCRNTSETPCILEAPRKLEIKDNFKTPHALEISDPSVLDTEFVDNRSRNLKKEGMLAQTAFV